MITAADDSRAALSSLSPAATTRVHPASTLKIHCGEFCISCLLKCDAEKEKKEIAHHILLSSQPFVFTTHRKEGIAFLQPEKSFR